MAIAQRISDGNLNLTSFQTTVQQEEQIVGPLVAIGNDGTNNVLTFKRALGVPAAKLVILDVYSGHPAARPNHSLICVGKCRVGGITTDVAAYRPV